MKILERYPELIPVLHDGAEFPFATCYTRTHPEGALAEEDVAAALIVSMGSYADAARVLRRSRKQVFDFTMRHPQLVELREEVFETALDDIETSYLRDAIQGDPAARKHFLLTLGKNRGHTTRVEQTGKDGEPMEYQEINRTEEARRAAFVLQNAMRNKTDEPDPSAERTH